MRKKEIMAPARDRGEIEELKSEGADAMYCGIRGFCRWDDGSLSLDGFIELSQYAASCGIIPFAALNGMPAPGNARDFLETAGACIAAGAGVILKDPGCLRELRALYPLGTLVASVGLCSLNSWEVEMLCALGASRVVLPREITSAEVREIKDRCDVEIEVMVNGWKDFLYPGKCRLGSYAAGAGQIRGCGFICRADFQLDERKINLEPQADDSFETIRELIPYVNCFKISRAGFDARERKEILRKWRKIIDGKEAEEPCLRIL